MSARALRDKVADAEEVADCLDGSRQKRVIPEAAANLQIDLRPNATLFSAEFSDPPTVSLDSCLASPVWARGACFACLYFVRQPLQAQAMLVERSLVFLGVLHVLWKALECQSALGISVYNYCSNV